MYILQLLKWLAGKVKVKSIDEDRGGWSSTEEAVLDGGEGVILALQWITTNVPAFTGNYIEEKLN